ncbi:DUF2093 domain-containing protein [Sphingomonas sp. 1P06PA]|uniref:DUF2093 domain-containing protein n=1 Tax=Sphingomonas sp. 1P06PA TaxID=554121 RepID=UPI0039A681D5
MLMSPGGRPARLHYMPNGFRMLVAGDHVVCAVSGEKIALDNLRYWSVSRQQPYASATLAAQAGLEQDS